MICVHKVWKLIGNNYDHWKTRKGGHLGFVAGLEKLHFFGINSYPH